ncbi:MAG: TPR domain/sulfotransferase domain protein [Parcubacteria group bacterium GW2011_GWA1_53_13]|uniref:TPR domain/sulfotransferase domain protein n=1 Tax=Candidatus Adlerbacteria bacterium GW2011_GWC1_50_9 TaxID=1618608 RepID=A0A0G1WRL7_9BACT|nr:MAG: TPR domain/sulfotransferase domain protein [Candidatus Adlerbacteria bacterium GW2011_GWC1_50_9]KKW33746.1 MAG: TPR domain/sulfotransferase domain protein [Parcubacteria group bacterium GW2011_GWA1_53_13]
MDDQTIITQDVKAEVPGGVMKNLAAMQGNLDAVAKYIVYAIAAFLPLWFLPAQVGIEFGREATFGVLIIAAGILWLLAVLTSGEIRFQHSLLLYAGGALLLIGGLSTAFSVTWATSLIYSDAISEKVSTLLLGVLLMVLIGGVLRSKGDAMVFLLTLVFAGGAGALFTAFQLLWGNSVWGWFAEFAGDRNFNVIGTMNGLSLFYSALLATSIGMIVSLKLGEWKRWVRLALYASAVLFAVDILLINYRYSWIVLLGVSIVLFGLTFRNVAVSRRASQSSETTARAGLDWRYLFAIILLVVSIFMYMFQPTVKQLNFPAEVSPAFRTTWKIGGSVLSEGPKQSLLGSGPGTFGLNWIKYKDPQVNQTIFWGVRFNQGFSWVSTLLSTIGILGTAAMLLFFVGSLFVFARALTKERGGADDSFLMFGVGPLAGLVAVVIAAFVYPANFSLILLLFLFAGILSYVLSEKRETGDGTSRGGGIVQFLLDFSERHVKFDSQWMVFISSLVVVFLLSLGIAGVYFELNRVRAAVSAAAGVLALNGGDTDAAATKLEEALASEPRNVNYANALVQVRIQRVASLIQRASNGENVQIEFQQEVNRANEVIQGAVNFLPMEPNLWRTRGALYELIIPFIPGAEGLSFESYRKAIEVSPANPAAYVDFARAGLTFVDNVQLRIGSVQGADRDQLIKTREAVLNEVKSVLEKGIQVKSDFAAAHFLLSQAAIRLGDVATAIQATENTKATAPFDIGVAFQLGLLYYQSGNLDASQGEFERAVSISKDYSNARYFLGLIYDRKGRKPEAIDQFEKIEALNPDNQEVKLILQNLRAGRGALDQIVPPAAPPEQRKEPPVGTQGR